MNETRDELDTSLFWESVEGTPELCDVLGRETQNEPLYSHRETGLAVRVGLGEASLHRIRHSMIHVHDERDEGKRWLFCLYGREDS